MTEKTNAEATQLASTEGRPYSYMSSGGARLTVEDDTPIPSSNKKTWIEKDCPGPYVIPEKGSQ